MLVSRPADARKAWVSAREGSRLLGVHPNMFPKIALAACIRVQVYPGCNPRYSREDVTRIASESVKSASGPKGIA